MDDTHMDNTRDVSKPQTRAPSPLIGLDVFVAAFGEAASRSSAIFRVSAHHWQAKSARSLLELTAQSESILTRLYNCKTPLEVLDAQQEWLRLRQRSCFDAGLRIGDALAHVARVARKQGRSGGKASSKNATSDPS